jgi:hypothetical protein
MKILLGIAGFFVLCIGLVGWKAYSWWHANGKAYVTAIKTAGDDGRLFGRTADNDACVKSAMDRFAADTTTLGALQGTNYVQNCLPESKPTQGFCDGVPAPKDFAAVREWEKGKCATVSTATDRACRMAIAPVPRFCHPRDTGNG